MTEEDIFAAFPPPYDLIKLDIEGSEYEFLTEYIPVLEKTKYLLLEWHSWHRGGGGYAKILKLAEERGFKLLKDMGSSDLIINNKPILCGISLFQRL